MKQLRSTLILLALALLIGGYIFFNERGPAVQEGNVVLLRADRNAVQTLQLRDGAKGVQLARDGENWQVAPLQNGKAEMGVPADADAVKALLDSVELVQSNAPISGGDLKAFGLDKTGKTIKVNGQSLEFGISPKFDPSRVYVRVGQQIALVPSTLSQSLAKSFDDWRDKHLLSFDNDKVNALNIQAPALSASFQKTDDHWNVTKPLAVAADAGAVSSLLSTLSTSQVSKWLDDKATNAAIWGLNKPTAKIQVGEASLTVGKKQNGGYAARNDSSASVFLLPAATFAAWNKPLASWRSKDVVSVKSSDLTQMVFTKRGVSKTLVKSGESWSVSGATSDETTNSRALDVVYWATGLQTSDFIDKPAALSTYGLDKPEIILAMTANESVNLKIGRAKGKLYASTGGTTVYELAPDALESLQNALDAFFPGPKPKTSTTAKVKN